MARESLEATARTGPDTTATRRELETTARPELETAPHPAEDATPPAEPVVPEDERSVPPAGDLDTHAFFSGPPSWPSLRGAVEEDPFSISAHDKVARSLAPQAIARRALFTRYVRVAVGVSVLLCVAAVVKTALTRDDEPPARHATVASEAPPASEAVLSAAEARPVGAGLPAESAPDAGDGGPSQIQPAAAPRGDLGAARALRVR